MSLILFCRWLGKIGSDKLVDRSCIQCPAVVSVYILVTYSGTKRNVNVEIVDCHIALVETTVLFSFTYQCLYNYSVSNGSFTMFNVCTLIQ